MTEMHPMRRKFEQLLKRQGGLYTFDDVMDHISRGLLQSFSDGNTWVITQVHTFPQKKVVDIAFIVGDVAAAVKLQPEIEEFAKSIGASALTASGREGWWGVHTPGWRKLSVNYVREL
jgi:hypothetical protein